ncbi:MAG: cytochrome-c oxidase, cbb3-type subunit III [Gammaproteobacteria bacterium]|nr:cytochrome-c oxidase, cbb3-type subunit III [Gammaproteobacteria bacterium]
MADFVSEFWSWFIIVPTVGGIVAMFWINMWLNAKPGELDGKPMSHKWDEDLVELNNPLPKWWQNLFYATLVFSCIYLVLYPGLGSFEGILKTTNVKRYNQEMADAEKTYGPLYEGYLAQDIRALAANGEAMKTARRLFMNYCTVCHGSDAGGAPGFPNLRDTDWLYGGEPDMIKASIMHGRQGSMPAWEAALGREGVLQVSEYVLSLSGRRVNANAAELGKVKYQQMCVACHGGDGKGNPAMGAPDLTDNIWLYGGSQKTVMQSIAAGRSGKMPAHKEFLGEAKSHLLAAYVYSLSAANIDR